MEETKEPLRDHPADPADTLRIVVSTDNHLGYEERDGVRGNDTFHTFAEVLRLAQGHRADMLLLGGDLFHENKPSRECLYRTMCLLRDAVFSDGGCGCRLHVDEASAALMHNEQGVNFLDAELGVALPIFCIHGNHDDPTSSSRAHLSALDLLQVSKYVNYFGVATDNDDIHIRPVMLQKGRTRLALYGLGNVRDERLYATWHIEKRVVFEEPPPSTDALDGDCLRLFVLHQNRERRGYAKAIHRDGIPEWMDLVVWGHEHPCRIQLEGSQPAVTQPGSTVATSLIDGEARPKHVGLLEVCGRRWRWTPIRLQTVRPFHFESLALREVPELPIDDAAAVERYLAARVTELVQQLNAEFDERHRRLGERVLPSRLRLPLIRLRVDHSGGYPTLSPARFGRIFIGQVANNKDILLFQRRAGRPLSCWSPHQLARRRQTLVRGVIPDAADEQPQQRQASGAAKETEPPVTVPDLLSALLRQHPIQLEVLTERELEEALERFVLKSEPRAIQEYVQQRIEEVCTLVARSSTDVENVDPVTMGKLARLSYHEQLAARAMRQREEAAERLGMGRGAGHVVSGEVARRGRSGGEDADDGSVGGSTDADSEDDSGRRALHASGEAARGEAHDVHDVIGGDGRTSPNSSPPLRQRKRQAVKRETVTRHHAPL
ncbi:hypothetical protein CDCA_CDCA11G3226 [Cyanidium caldarium]|uniref:Double-strand break repair protein n=1 Tax=Cyanidium caldarium TaxID=2771 RepID=A0AAV9IYH3_CYACA|nr:hypothetical protein CDCA_CDCA11G3226 [Cyanidium caldarium]